MIFVYKHWEEFCRALREHGLCSVPAREAGRNATTPYLVLKHDVETRVESAYRMAEIEHRYGHRGSYYVQAYLLRDKNNITLLRRMTEMGHEISYHYDVMDACRGDLDAAISEFEVNKELFEENGFPLKTVCQHGNPVVERVGYTSNRDFFRSERVRALYPELSDIMVNFAEMHATTYAYYSDAGRQFKRIYDPLTNDLFDSSDKDIPYTTFHSLLEALCAKENAIVSTHPHRYTASKAVYRIRALAFRAVRKTAKLLLCVPFMKRLMSKYYHLAKKM